MAWSISSSRLGSTIEVARARVMARLKRDYDTRRKPDLTPDIRSANLLVTAVAACETRKGVSSGADVLAEMEEWLAAYFYTRSDPIYASRSNMGSSGSFVSDTTATPERYKAGALAMDLYGCLAGILEKKKAGAFWNGRPPSEQTDYVLRD